MAAKLPVKDQKSRQLNELRQEHKAIYGKIAELDHDLNEHSLVIGVLKSADPERKCFQLIGGVLIEKKVNDVLPSVMSNRDLIQNTIGALKTKATAIYSKIQPKLDDVSEKEGEVASSGS